MRVSVLPILVLVLGLLPNPRVAEAAVRVDASSLGAAVLQEVAVEDTTAWYDAQSWLAALAGTVVWDPLEGRLTWTWGDHWVVLKAEPPYALRDGLPVAVAEPPRPGRDGGLWVSEAFIRETGSLLLGVPVKVLPWGRDRLHRVVVDPAGSERSRFLAEVVAGRLEAEGFDVFRTDAGEEVPDPTGRAAFTNYREADLYLGVVVVDRPRGLAAGYEVFVPVRPPEGIEPQRWTAGQVGVFDDSIRWADQLRAGLGEVLPTFDRGRTALPSPVLEAVVCPAAVVELLPPAGMKDDAAWRDAVAGAVTRAAVAIFSDVQDR